ncbi:MAG TPA: hypothetical protein VIM09_00260 [Chthoniobacterales bacterium]
MKSSVKKTLSIAAASCLALAGSAFASPPAGTGASSHASGSGGNSSFGLNQRTDLSTGSGNSSFGRTTSANARLRSNDADDENDQDVDRDNVKTKKIKKTKLTNPGNSAFGRSQRVNHLKGSGNNIYGKTTSANAKLKHANKKNGD